jgi:hypothetical protein
MFAKLRVIQVNKAGLLQTGYNIQYFSLLSSHLPLPSPFTVPCLTPLLVPLLLTLLHQPTPMTQGMTPG